MKTILTHLSVDLDSIACCWLIKKFMPGWSKAEIKFLPASTNYKNNLPDSNPDILYVDTGLGKFDHHQYPKYLSATKLVFDYLKKEKNIKVKDETTLIRLVDLITLIDNFGECKLPNPSDDFYDLGMHQIIEGLKNKFSDDLQTTEFSFNLLDCLFFILKKKIDAEKEIKKGFIFNSQFGKSLAMETKNEEAVRLAQKLGYFLVIRRDPIKGWIRIKVRPDCKIGLDSVYKKILTLDSKASWFFHVSKKMLLNGSSQNPNVIPSRLSLKKIIEIVKEI